MLKLFAVGTTDDVIAVESLVDSKYGRVRLVVVTLFTRKSNFFYSF